MSDLWETASREIEGEALESTLTAARLAAAQHLPFLLAATSPADFDNRLALADDRLAAVARSVTGGDPVLFGVVHTALKASATEDFQVLHEAALERQRVEAGRQARHARRRALAAEGETCSVCGDKIAKDADGSYHHDNGVKHDHEAKAGGSKESSRRRTASLNEWLKEEKGLDDAQILQFHSWLGTVSVQDYDGPDDLWAAWPGSKTASRRTAGLTVRWEGKGMRTEFDTDSWPAALERIESYLSDRVYGGHDHDPLTPQQMQDLRDGKSVSVSGYTVKVIGASTTAVRRTAGRYDDLRALIQSGTTQNIDGHPIDLNTAAMLMRIYNAADAEQRATLDGTPIHDLIRIAWQHNARRTARRRALASKTALVNPQQAYDEGVHDGVEDARAGRPSRVDLTTLAPHSSEWATRGAQPSYWSQGYAEGYQQRAALASRRTAGADEGKATQWGSAPTSGPGWYVFKDGDPLDGPFASKEEAEAALEGEDESVEHVALRRRASRRTAGENPFAKKDDAPAEEKPEQEEPAEKPEADPATPDVQSLIDAGYQPMTQGGKTLEEALAAGEPIQFQPPAQPAQPAPAQQPTASRRPFV